MRAGKEIGEGGACAVFANQKKKGRLITGEIVPSGSLQGNKVNACSRMSVGDRWDEVVETCAVIMANAMDRRRPRTEGEESNEFKAEGES